MRLNVLSPKCFKVFGQLSSKKIAQHYGTEL